VCLHCRREARAKARARFQRRVVRTGTIATVVVAVGVIGFETIRGVRGGAPTEPTVAERVAGSLEPEHPERGAKRGSPATEPVAGETMTSSLTAVAIAAPPPASAPHRDTLASATRNGRRIDLGDGAYAMRAGSRATVHFDTPGLRTRRRDKFERVLRLTLPEIYGALIDSLLARTPSGELVPVGSLPAELESSGLHLALADGRVLAVWPKTRPADGGPLVVAYEAALTR
jgi:hypothetical protein